MPPSLDAYVLVVNKVSNVVNPPPPIPSPPCGFSAAQAAHPSHPALAKFAYNLVMSLRRFSYHPEVKLCLRVLSGSLPEEAYHDRVKMEKGLLVMFRACDAQRNGGSGWDQTTTGLVSMDDAVKVLNRYFPEKPDHAQVPQDGEYRFVDEWRCSC